MAEKLQFLFDEEALLRLDALKGKGNFPDRAKTVRAGLQLLEWLHNEVDRSYNIKIEDANGEQIAQFPARLLFK